MNDDDIKNPFSDPEFRDMLLRKEGIKITLDLISLFQKMLLRE